MKELGVTRPLVLLVAGAVVMGAVAFASVAFMAPNDAPQPMGFWEAAARGLVSVVMVNETFEDNGHSVTLPVGIQVTNTASVPVVVSEEAVLFSPHPSQTPQPAPTNTTQNVILTLATIPASGKLLYSYGPYVVQGMLSGPAWWCLEEMHFTKAGVAFYVGGETLPFALRGMIEHPYYTSADDNTQTALYAYLRSDPAVVVGKQPLWSTVNGAAGQTVRVRIDATNVAVWATDDTYTANVNVSQGVIADQVPAGWTVEEGSFSVQPMSVVTNANGSQTLKWVEALPATQVSTQMNPNVPTPYTTVTLFYTLVAPALNLGNYSLPRATSDMNQTGTADAHSAPVIVEASNPPPVADAGGPYSGNEGEPILLNASASRDPDGEPLQFRWSFTDNGTWDTSWSSSPTATVTYTDEFAGHVRVEATDGHSMANATASVTIANVPPTIESLSVSRTATASFRLVLAGEKWHDATFVLQANGTTVVRLRVLREPGNPAAQSLASGNVTLELTKPIAAWVLYTPADDRVNGQPNGDTPAQLIVTLAGGTSAILGHNFNVEHPGTWNWSLRGLSAVLGMHGVELRAHFSDPGADALTAHWDFGDGSTATQGFPNGPADDAPETVIGGTPMDVVTTMPHTYAAAGSYTVTLTVTDADGGAATATVTVQVP